MHMTGRQWDDDSHRYRVMDGLYCTQNILVIYRFAKIGTVICTPAALLLNVCKWLNIAFRSARSFIMPYDE